VSVCDIGEETSRVGTSADNETGNERGTNNEEVPKQSGEKYETY